MSMRSPVAGSVPGRIEPSDRIIAGGLCSRSAASVPTGGLSQATTAIGAGNAVGLQVQVEALVDELAADQGEAHGGGCR